MALPIPTKALEQHIVALGKTRSGKSSKLRVVVEHLLRAEDAPVCIIDPKGDWWGLKSSADGRRSGFPLVIFGGEHADVPINEHAGAQVAELVATGNRSCLIDLGGWMVAARTRFFIDYASALFRLTKGRRYQVIDECHNFAPKGKIFDPDAGKALHWANRLASEGQGKGLILLAASQRPQKVHNDFLTSCETLIACRVIHKADRDAIKDWIDGCADAMAGKQVLAELAQMPRTDAWVWSPEIDFGPKRITFPMFETYDSFKPQAADAGKLKGWAEVDLDEVRAKLGAVVEQAKANDPAELKRRIRELEQQLKSAKPTDPSEENLHATRLQGFSEGRSEALEHSAAVLRTLSEDIAGMFSVAIRKPATTFDFVAASSHGRINGAPPEAPKLKPASGTRARGVDSGVKLPSGERATLAACIQFPNGLRREQLTVLTGYKRSSRDAYIQRLRDRGYIETPGGLVRPTFEGVAALPDAEPLPTGAALQRYWLQRLPEGERKVLEILISAYPKAVQRVSIDERTGYQRSSRDAYLQRMRAKQLITEPSRGEVRASEDLF